MVHRVGRAPHIFRDGLVCLHRWPRRQLLLDPLLQGRLFCQLTRQLHARHQHLLIMPFRVGKIGKINARRVRRIGRTQLHRAPALGASHVRRQGKAVGRRRIPFRHRVHVKRLRAKMEHHVGCVQPWLGKSKQTHFPQLSRLLRHRAGGLPVHHPFRMVQQILADARQMVPHLNAHFLQVVARANARKHQQLGRIKRAATQNNFALGKNRAIQRLYTNGPIAV